MFSTSAAPSPMSATRAHRKENADLKRPDLKGNFVCGSCEQHFAHAASLNRHRITHHSSEQTCQLCDRQLDHTETVRQHMLHHHSLPRVFTCGCCNWTFADKKQLNAHVIAWRDLGILDENAKPIAKSDKPPGSLSQFAIQGLPRPVKTAKRRHSVLSVSPTSSRASSSSPDTVLAEGLDLTNPEVLRIILEAQKVMQKKERLSSICDLLAQRVGLR